MMRKGAFTFVLHSHLPYCRRAGQWPHGEEWLHEAASESYLPLLKALCSLREGGSPFKLTLGLTPVLVEQLADPLVCQHFETFMEDKLHRATADEQRFQKAGESHRAALAQFYFRWYEDLLRDFRETFHGDLIGSFRRLQEEG
ncbi:MAG: hypothetical protein Q8O76_02585, partial [Chloroflexota bacterium]|nr:hypothetical protein [Chloroflexota bacterium]